MQGPELKEKCFDLVRAFCIQDKVSYQVVNNVIDQILDDCFYALRLSEVVHTAFFLKEKLSETSDNSLDFYALKVFIDLFNNLLDSGYIMPETTWSVDFEVVPASIRNLYVNNVAHSSNGVQVDSNGESSRPGSLQLHDDMYLLGPDDVTDDLNTAFGGSSVDAAKSEIEHIFNSPEIRAFPENSYSVYLNFCKVLYGFDLQIFNSSKLAAYFLLENLFKFDKPRIHSKYILNEMRKCNDSNCSMVAKLLADKDAVYSFFDKFNTFLDGFLKIDVVLLEEEGTEYIFNFKFFENTTKFELFGIPFSSYLRSTDLREFLSNLASQKSAYRDMFKILVEHNGSYVSLEDLDVSKRDFAMFVERNQSYFNSIFDLDVSQDHVKLEYMIHA